jgi:hypothetical protein
MLISQAYRDLNRQLHAEREDYGRRGAHWAPYVERLVNEEAHCSVLDYGCGKGTLMAALPHMVSAEYDPAIPGKDARPAPADLVVCTDVIEHVEPANLDHVLRDLRRLTKRKLLFSISTVPAKKTLADGRNAHLIVQPPKWWHQRLAQHFHVLSWHVRPQGVYGEAFPRPASERAFQRAKQRRKMTEPLRELVESWVAQINRYSDDFSKVSTWSMWEGVGDERADIQVAWRILEAWPDANDAMHELVPLASKAVICMIELGDGRTSSDWGKLLGRHIRIAHTETVGKGLLIVGAPRVVVDGLEVAGAVGPEDRWEQVAANVERIKARIQPAPAHERRAVLVCYGPSLNSTMPKIAELAAAGCDVVSVSGAHDALLAAGIVPRYHIECDPRPHKADNIEKAHAGVEYLLASCIHARVIDKVLAATDRVRLWHVSAAEHTHRLVDELGEAPGTCIAGGGSVGLRAIPVLYAYGYRDVAIFAMDCSFADDGAQWAGKHAGKKKDEVPVKCGGRIFRTSPVLLSYACGFFDTTQRVPGIKYELFGDGLLQEMAWHYANGSLEAA